MKPYQVVIIGGGPAGTSCALALSNLGIENVAIIEAKSDDKFRIGESIPPESSVIMRQLGIWDAFCQEGHDPCYGSCSYWGSDKRGYNDFLLSPYGYGWHLNRTRFNTFLLKQTEDKGVKVFKNATYQSSTKTEDGGFKLFLEGENRKKITITTSLVVDATGTRALFATQQGSKKINGTSLVCLAAIFTIDDIKQSYSKLTHLEASPYGWWYAAQLPNQQFLAGLYTDANTIKQYQLQQLKEWKSLLEQTQAMHLLLSNFSLQETTFRGFSAPSFCLNEIVGKNWMAIGDAASAYDPITSQGIMKSLSNGHLAAKVLQEKIQNPKNRLIDFHFIVKEQYQQYITMRKGYYEREMRWKHMPFWKKMQTKKEQTLL